MQTKPKSNSVITHSVAAGVITFNVLGAGSTSLRMADVSPEVMARAAIHGMIQRISDAAAISRNQETGATATPEEKLAAMEAITAHYASGTADWSRARTSGGERDTSGITMQAIARVKGCDVAAAEKMVNELAVRKGVERKDILATLRKSAAVAEAVLAIRSENIRPAVDADAALAELA